MQVPIGKHSGWGLAVLCVTDKTHITFAISPVSQTVATEDINMARPYCQIKTSFNPSRILVLVIDARGPTES